MGQYHGSLRMVDESGPGIAVEIDLTDETITMTSGPTPLGQWDLENVRINAELDGFHMRAEGEEVVLDITEDARFAVDIGLRSAPPLLRRKMSAILRED